MKLTFVNETDSRTEKDFPKKFITQWMRFLDVELKRRQVRQWRRLAKAEITIVALLTPKAKKLNQQYRQRNYATDILSFEGDGQAELGDLVLCWPVLHRQAKEHGLTFNQELAYMLTHGVLHLLGYDHEMSKKESEIMLSLQDKVFARGIASLKLYK